MKIDLRNLSKNQEEILYSKTDTSMRERVSRKEVESEIAACVAEIKERSEYLKKLLFFLAYRYSDGYRKNYSKYFKEKGLDTDGTPLHATLVPSVTKNKSGYQVMRWRRERRGAVKKGHEFRNKSVRVVSSSDKSKQLFIYYEEIDPGKVNRKGDFSLSIFNKQPSWAQELGRVAEVTFRELRDVRHWISKFDGAVRSLESHLERASIVQETHKLTTAEITAEVRTRKAAAKQTASQSL